VALPVVIAENTTGGDIFLSRIGVNVPALSTVNLSGAADDPATFFECATDESLIAAVTADDITINDGTSDLSSAEGLAYLNASGNLNGPVTGAAVGALIRLLDLTGRYTEVTDIVLHDPAAADPAGPSTNGDLYYNTVIEMWMAYDEGRGKWLSLEGDTFQVGQNGVVPVGTYYKGVAGKTLSATLGYTAPFNGTIVSMSFARSNTADTDFEVMASGAQIETLNTGAGASGYSNTLDGDFSQGAILAVRNDADGGQTRDAQVWVRMKWRA